MVVVRAWVKEDAYKLDICGHADYNPGEDVVCAGVSSIAFALLGYLENHRKDMTPESGWSWDHGDVQVQVRGGEALEAVFQMALIGLMQIAKKYPNHVRCEIKCSN